MIKKILFLFMALCVRGALAGTMQEIFLKANAEYVAGNINEAIKLYQSVAPKGAALWYNLGICNFKVGNYVEAIVDWRRAQKYASWRDYSTLENYIEQSYDALGIRQGASFLSRINSWSIRGSLLISMFFIQICFLCCLFVLCLSFSRLIRTRRYYVLIMLILATILVALSGIFKYRIQEYPYGIVTKSSISVYAGPGVDYVRIKEAKVLDTVRIYQKRDGWLKVRMDHLGYGWIQEVDLAVI